MQKNLEKNSSTPKPCKATNYISLDRKTFTSILTPHLQRFVENWQSYLPGKKEFLDLLKPNGLIFT